MYEHVTFYKYGRSITISKTVRLSDMFKETALGTIRRYFSWAAKDPVNNEIVLERLPAAIDEYTDLSVQLMIYVETELATARQKLVETQNKRSQKDHGKDADAIALAEEIKNLEKAYKHYKNQVARMERIRAVYLEIFGQRY